MDLLDEDSVHAAGEVIRATGPLFGLVNNAGVALPGPLETILLEVFRRQIEINLTAQLLVTQVMLPALHRSAEAIDDARIIMIGSIGGRLSGPMLGGYGAAKHGLVGLSSSLRAELAPFKIKVVLIEPRRDQNADLEPRSRAPAKSSSHAVPRATAAMPNKFREQPRWGSGWRLQGLILPFQPRSSSRLCRARILHQSRWSAARPR
jgi:NAD(P)-dependent dehydrogenase (short-subunit alcohol dehydrogenase family)